MPFAAQCAATEYTILLSLFIFVFSRLGIHSAVLRILMGERTDLNFQFSLAERNQWQSARRSTVVKSTELRFVDRLGQQSFVICWFYLYVNRIE